MGHFQKFLMIDILHILCEIVLRLKPEDTFDDKSTRIQEMAWGQIKY